VAVARRLRLYPLPGMTEITIYTDGACSGNGQGNARGGWAAIVKLDCSDAHRELSGGERGATNQRMEIRAVIEGLKALKRPSTLTLYSDSSYVINCMNEQWYLKWRKNGWVSSKRQPVANRELWEELLAVGEDSGHDVTFKKVDGHADEKPGHVSDEHEIFNQRCDELAVAAVPA
jgi:ribonuclease HI